MSDPKYPLRIAFYAPLKPPDHPIPSGDRQMARMLLAALNQTGHDAFLASRYISYSKRHGEEHMAARIAGAKAEAKRLLVEWSENGYAPDLWFCYHPYDKSPDWLGMEICTALNIPMITAEPCKTGQGPNGEWEPWRAEAQKGIRMAAVNIVMTHSDHEYLKTFIPKERIVWLKPFVDASLLEKAAKDTLPVWPSNAAASREAVKLLTVGMMRPGAKLQSYTVLAEALGMIDVLDWSLIIAGGGPCEQEVRELLSRHLSSQFENRINIAGELLPEQVISLMERADILAWPGSREAYGMVYLEAATQGTPAVALDNMGVPLVVEHERTGLLASPPDVPTYAAQLRRLITDLPLRHDLASGARDFVFGERSLEQAADQLAGIVTRVIETETT